MSKPARQMNAWIIFQKITAGTRKKAYFLFGIMKCEAESYHVPPSPKQNL